MAAEVVDKNLLDDEEDEFSKDSVSMRKLREITQCGNFRIFPSLKFYVKSILENLEVLKLPFLPIFGLQSAKIHKKIKIQSLQMC